MSRFAAVVCFLLGVNWMLREAHAKEVEMEFKVVPNKAGDIEVALDTPPIPSSTCRFEWDSSGATVEVGSAVCD